jgi:hypothetical protein
MYIKFVSAERMQSILQDIQGQQEYEHDNGEIYVVTVELASMGVGEYEWRTYLRTYRIQS